MELLLFRVKPEHVQINPGSLCDFLVTAELSSYMGRPQITMIVKDYRKSGLKQAKYFAAKQTYEQFSRQEPLSPAFYRAITPDREIMIQVYRQIPETEIQIDALYGAVAEMPHMNYCMLRLILDIFEELGLVQQDVWTEQVCRRPVQKKVDLQSSRLLQELRGKGVDAI